MEYLHIAVVSADQAYNRVFCMSLLHVCRQLQVTSYSSRQFLKEWSEYRGSGDFNDQFDLVLWAGNEISDSYGGNIVYLTDRPSLISMDYAGRRFAIYQYNPVSTILAKIFDIYAHLTGRSMPLVRREDVRVMAFASYEGGAGCTTVARAVAQELARFRGKRVLYLSLEDVDSSEEFVTVPAGIRREDELLYRLLGRGKTPFLESYLVRDAFDVCALAPAAGRNPLRELDGQDMELLLATLMDSGMFDVIVADLSTCLTEAAAAVMEPAGRICLITKGTGGSRERSYRNQIAGFGKEIPDKVVRAVNRASGTEEAANGTFYIRKAEEDQVDGAPLEGEFGRDISKLTEAMLNVVE